MKKLSFLALAAVGLLLSACTDKDEVNTAQITEEFTDGGYIGISLQLPSADQSITRAEETGGNDKLSNGTEDEFEVKNATLYIFKLAKSSEANPDEAATYVEKVSLGNSYDPDQQGGINPDKWGEQSGVSTTKITSTYNQATLIPNKLASDMKADVTNNYYAYVILNHNGQVEVAEGDNFKKFCDQEFDVIGADIAAVKNIWETGLVMTNAPICSKQGGEAAPASGAKYTTLVPLDNTKIFGSKSEAEAAPAACVYVERAAVKITVEDHRTETTLGGYDVSIDGWKVINNEATYYNTRHINSDGTKSSGSFVFEDWGGYSNSAATSNPFRFVSFYEFKPQLPGSGDHTTGYRTYFAHDPQYNTDASLQNTSASDDRPWILLEDNAGNPNHAYTTENTFDVQHQTWQNTTMVTLKVTMSKGTGDSKTYPDFYTVGKGSQVMYLDDPTTATNPKTGLDKAKAAIENIVKGDNDVAAAMTALRNKISQNNTGSTITSGLTVNIDDIPTTGTTDVEFTVVPAYKKNNAAYTSYSTTKDASDSNDKSEQDLYEELVAAITAVLDGDANTTGIQTADAVLLSFYKGGVSYYNVRIKHFGEVETPWSAGGDYIAGGGTNVNEIYFGALKTATLTSDQITAGQSLFLGRYGVVRDNWYKLSVDKIGKIGTAEPVDPSTTTPDTPDDEIENFISVHVHIVPWVLRSQSVEF